MAELDEELDMVTSACNLRTQEAEDRGPSWGLGQPGIHGETLSQAPTEEERKGRQKDVDEGEEASRKRERRGRRRKKRRGKKGGKGAEACARGGTKMAAEIRNLAEI